MHPVRADAQVPLRRLGGRVKGPKFDPMHRSMETAGLLDTGVMSIKTTHGLDEAIIESPDPTSRRVSTVKATSSLGRGCHFLLQLIVDHERRRPHHRRQLGFKPDLVVAVSTHRC
jgi:hypothetical protein